MIPEECGRVGEGLVTQQIKMVHPQHSWAGDIFGQRKGLQQ